MATGLPDYYRGVDIAYQALAEMIVRPKYGGCQKLSADVNVDANTETVLCSVSGKGMIYGGGIVCTGVATQKDDSIKIYLDGVNVYQALFSSMESLNHYSYIATILRLIKYDDAAFKYVVEVLSNYTFETSLSISYVETEGRTPRLNVGVLYALI